MGAVTPSNAPREGRRFRDRREAGRMLVPLLEEFAGVPGVLVLGLPRGGVPVAYEVAVGLGAALDVLVVRKLGVPSCPEMAMGAVASGGVKVLLPGVIARLGVSQEAVQAVTAAETQVLQTNERLFRGEHPPFAVQDCTAIVVDDGLATGATMSAAVETLARRGAGKVVVAVPTAALSTCEALRRRGCRVVTVVESAGFSSVGEWYRDFTQVGDDDVRQLLEQARNFPTGSRTTGIDGAKKNHLS